MRVHCRVPSLPHRCTNASLPPTASDGDPGIGPVEHPTTYTAPLESVAIACGSSSPWPPMRCAHCSPPNRVREYFAMKPSVPPAGASETLGSAPVVEPVMYTPVPSIAVAEAPSEPAPP